MVTTRIVRSIHTSGKMLGLVVRPQLLSTSKHKLLLSYSKYTSLRRAFVYNCINFILQVCIICQSCILHLAPFLPYEMCIPSAFSSKWGINRTGYLVPGRDGPRVWPDGRVAGALSSPLASPGNEHFKQFQFLALNRSHMRDLAMISGWFCVKLRRDNLL